jgi:hypothetical protein
MLLLLSILAKDWNFLIALKFFNSLLNPIFFFELIHKDFLDFLFLVLRFLFSLDNSSFFSIFNFSNLFSNEFMSTKLWACFDICSLRLLISSLMIYFFFYKNLNHLYIYLYP